MFERGVKFAYGNSSCSSVYVNLQSYLRYVSVLSHKTGILEEEPQNVTIINIIGSVVEKDVLVFSANIEMSEVLHKKFFSSSKNN